MTMSFAMNVTLFTFTVVALTVGSLDDTGGAYPVATVTMAVSIAHKAWQQAHNKTKGELVINQNIYENKVLPKNAL